jgi:hypothetical protein
MTAAATLTPAIGYRFSRIPEELRSEVDREVARITDRGTADLEGVEDVIIRYLPSDLSRRVEDAMQLVHPLTHDYRDLVPHILKYLTPADVANLRKVNSFFRKHINAAHEYWGDVADLIVPSRRIHDFTFRAPGLRPRAEYQAFAKTALAKLRRQYGLTMTSPPPSLAHIEALRHPSLLPDGLSSRERIGFKLLRMRKKVARNAGNFFGGFVAPLALFSLFNARDQAQEIKPFIAPITFILHSLFYLSPLCEAEDKKVFRQGLLLSLISYLFLRTVDVSENSSYATQVFSLLCISALNFYVALNSGVVICKVAAKFGETASGRAMTRLANRLLDVRRS